MTTQRLDPHSHPIHWPASATALLTIAILLILSATVYVPSRVESIINTAFQGAPAAASSRLPFTVKEVQTYFGRELGTLPEQFGRTIIYPQAATVDDAEDYEVAVTALERGSISVAFRGSGEAALELAREFCGSAIFRSTETATLVSMVERRHEWPSARLPRFQVDVRTLELIDMYQLTLQFSPAP
jgi:hypothetical protein